ncbi:MAG: sigma-70 family RNA polymerase sigma factor [Verrucomicrobia bacterium]|nr:sigma-70 family RNA polymerase sigma factor [Verrucomicrobiota bacterium]
MQEPSDAQLLRDYATRGSESAFRELVTRHTDLIYSAALRQVSSPDLAGDIVQSVFTDLARKAREVAAKFPVEASLAGWLHRAARYAALNHLRGTRRRQFNERQAMAQLLTDSESAADWELIRPALDEALDSLDDDDREALLLRYFKNRDFRSVGLALGVSDDSAQKRVSRAVERLREFFAKRGVTVGAGGLVVVISANAVQAAPVGLAATISAAALAAGMTVGLTSTSTIAMTTLQKITATTALAAAVGIAVYEARQVAGLREQVQSFVQRQQPLTKQVAALQNHRDLDAARLAALAAELADARNDNRGMHKLRGEAGVLRLQLAEAQKSARQPPSTTQPPLATAEAHYRRALTNSWNRNYEASLEDLNKFLESEPNSYKAHYLRGELYARSLPKERGGAAQAVKEFTRALELKPDDAFSRFERAFHSSDTEQAISDYTFLIEGHADWSAYEGSDSQARISSDIADAYRHRGAIQLFTKEDFRKAITDFTAALQMNPSLKGVYRLRGLAYQMVGEMEKAKQDFSIEPK